MEYKSSLKKEIEEKIDNYYSYADDIKSLILKLDLAQENSEPIELNIELRKKMIFSLLTNGTLNNFFSKKNLTGNFEYIIDNIKNVISKFSGGQIKTDTNKFQTVIWLRDNEKPAETYSFYNSGNTNLSLYAKVGLNQRSYKLWSNGGRDGDYVDVYYNHLKNIKLHSFFPHNDRRFSHITSNFLSSNSEAREYLLKREEVWKSIYNVNVTINKYFIEKIFAFSYILQQIDKYNAFKLSIEIINSVLHLKLLCKIKLDKNDFKKILDKYGIINVKVGIDFHIEYGESTRFIEPSQKEGINGVNAFYKLKNNIESSKKLICEILKKHNSIITSNLSDDMLFQIFLDILIFKIDSNIDSYNDKAKMEKLQSIISPKIIKLNKEVDRLKKSEVDLNKEALIINRMNAQLVEWHKLVDTKISSLKVDNQKDTTLNIRDL